MAREPRDGRSGGGRDRDRGHGGEGDDLIDKLVTINRVAKVVKGGRRFAFAALVVVGDQKGRVGYGAGKVVLRSATAGTGIIAGGPMRAVFETLGIGDVVAKSFGSRNPHNMVKATFDALQRCASPRSVATRRGKKVSDLLGKRDAPGQEGVDA